MIQEWAWDVKNLPEVGSGNSPVISICNSKKRCNVTFVGKACTPL